MKTIPTKQFAAAASTREDFRDRGAAGFDTEVFKELVTIASASADTTLDMEIPANFVIEGSSVKAATDITYATAVAFGLGVSGDLNRISEFAQATIEDKNQQGDSILGTPDLNPTKFNPHLYSTNGSGTAAGTIQGTFAVVIWGYYIPQIEQFS